MTQLLFFEKSSTPITFSEYWGVRDHKYANIISPNNRYYVPILVIPYKINPIWLNFLDYIIQCLSLKEWQIIKLCLDYKRPVYTQIPLNE